MVPLSRRLDSAFPKVAIETEADLCVTIHFHSAFPKVAIETQEEQCPPRDVREGTCCDPRPGSVHLQVRAQCKEYHCSHQRVCAVGHDLLLGAIPLVNADYLRIDEGLPKILVRHAPTARKHCAAVSSQERVREGPEQHRTEIPII